MVAVLLFPGISSGRITRVSPPSFQTVVPFAGNPLPRSVADSSRAGGDSASLFFPGLRHRNAVDYPALEEHVSEAPSKHALKQPMSLTPLSRGGTYSPQPQAQNITLSGDCKLIRHLIYNRRRFISHPRCRFCLTSGARCAYARKGLTL